MKLVNVPSGSSVYYRAGYYEGGDENAVERTLTNAEVIMNDIPQNDVRIAALAAPFPRTSNERRCRSSSRSTARTSQGAPKSAVNAELYVYAFDDEGIVRDRSTSASTSTRPRPATS